MYIQFCRTLADDIVNFYLALERYCIFSFQILDDEAYVIAQRNRLKTTKLFYYQAIVLWVGAFGGYLSGKPFERYYHLLKWCQERSIEEEIIQQLVRFISAIILSNRLGKLIRLVKVAIILCFVIKTTLHNVCAVHWGVCSTYLGMFRTLAGYHDYTGEYHD